MTMELVTAILMGVVPHKEVPVMDQITAATIEAQNKYGIEAELLLAMIKTESNFNPKAIGRAKEVGLLQIHPKYHKTTTFDIRSNISQGAHYLSTFKEKCQKRYATAWFICYNVGPNKVIKNPKQFAYYKKVKAFYVEAKKIKNLYAGRAAIPSQGSIRLAKISQ